MTTNRLGLLVLLLGAFAFALAGCGGGGGGGGGNPDPNPDPGNAQYDMSGDWLIVVTNPIASTPDEQDPDEVLVVTVAQSGGTVTVPVPDGGPDLTGTVDVATYDLERSYPDGGGTTTDSLQFQLVSADEGNGTLTWSWTDGSVNQNSTADVSLFRLKAPTYSVSGEWNYNLTPGDRAPPRSLSMPPQGLATITMSGNELTFVAPGVTFEGYVTGPDAWLVRSGSEDGGEASELMRIVFSSSTNGAGDVFWRWWDATEQLNGQDVLNLFRIP